MCCKVCLENHKTSNFLYSINLVKLQALFVCISLLPYVASIAESKPDYTPPYGEKINPKPFQYEYGLQSSGQDAAFKKIEIQVFLTLYF